MRCLSTRRSPHRTICVFTTLFLTVNLDVTTSVWGRRGDDTYTNRREIGVIFVFVVVFNEQIIWLTNSLAVC